MAEDQRQYRDRLFNFIFGSEENRAWTLSLYNAVNGSSYTDADAIQIMTIREVMYLGMRNDLAFLISDEISLYEQQSTYNPNMPLRMMQYLGNLYEKYLTQNRKSKYGRRLLRLPVPRLVVFYNGKEDLPDEQVLRLSDSFPEGAEADVEVRVRMVNVNHGRSAALLAACRPLREYAWLVNRIQTIRRNEKPESAIDRAISEIPEDFILRPVLLAHRSEVKGMLLTEYNEAEEMELYREACREEFREEFLEEGREEGRAEGTISTLIGLVRKKLLPLELAAKEANMTEDAFLVRMQAAD